MAEQLWKRQKGKQVKDCTETCFFIDGEMECVLITSFL